MGNREDLLAGARRCLLEKGYSRTTARDIATASGVSLAAIGYHFGSKDALLNEAMFQAIGEWGDQIEAAFAEADSQSPAERFEKIWTNIARTFDENRTLWLASFELVMQADHIPGAKEAFQQAMPMARTGLASLFLGVEESAIEPDVQMSVGGVLYSLMAGWFIQRFADVANVPGSADMARGIRMLADWLTEGTSPVG